MKPHRLVIVDIDQTLLDSPYQKLPSRAFVDTVQRIAGHTLVGCATGRAFSWALPVLRATHFTSPCILGGGALIVDPQTYKVIESASLPTSSIDAIKSVLTKYPATNVLFNDYTAEDYLGGGWQLQRLLKSARCDFIDVVGLTHPIADELIAQFCSIKNVQAIKMNGYRDGMVDLLVSHIDANKTQAIKRLQSRLHISIQNTTGIGNGYNDIQLFDAVGTKVAVANAVQELKESADTVIEDVKNDAVARYLQTLYIV